MSAFEELKDELRETIDETIRNIVGRDFNMMVAGYLMTIDQMKGGKQPDPGNALENFVIDQKLVEVRTDGDQKPIFEGRLFITNEGHLWMQSFLTSYPFLKNLVDGVS